MFIRKVERGNVWAPDANSASATVRAWFPGQRVQVKLARYRQQYVRPRMWGGVKHFCFNYIAR